MKKIAALATLTALVSCASLRVTPVQPYGEATFTVGAESHSPITARAGAIDAANAHCGQQGKAMVPQSEVVSGRKDRTITIVFVCR